MSLRAGASRFFVFPLLCATVFVTSCLCPPMSATARADASEFELNNVVIEGHLDVEGYTELDRLLAIDNDDRAFFAANLPGINAYDGGWAMLDLDQLNAGPEHAILTFQTAPVYYEAGGISSSGHFVALRKDARIWAENNRNDVVVYDLANPAAPKIYGEYRMQKPAGVFRNTIYDMAVYDNRAYLLVSVLGMDASANFRGIVVLDVSAPDPGTKQLPEIGRYAYPITIPLLNSGNRLYAPAMDGTIYGFDLSAGLSLLGTYAAGSDFVPDIAFGENGLIGRDQGQPTLIEFDAGSSFSNPLVTPILGEQFAAYGATGELLLATGRDHDVVIVWPELTGEIVAGFTVGSVDVVSARASAASTTRLADGDFLLGGDTDLYRLRQDGWRPSVELLAVNPGIEVNGQPMGQGERVTIQSGVEVTCPTSPLSFTANNDPLIESMSGPTASGNACRFALSAICAKGSGALGLFTFAALTYASNYCTYLAETEQHSYEKCLGLQIVPYIEIYLGALGKLCEYGRDSTTADRMVLTDIDADARVEMQAGGFSVTGEADGHVYAMDAPSATATVVGPGRIEAFNYPPAGTTVFAATNVPITIVPHNLLFAPFTLQPGQMVGVTADEVLPVASSTHFVYLPLLSR